MESCKLPQGLDDIDSGLQRRDQELYEDFLRVVSGTKYYDDYLKAVTFFINQRHSEIYNSIEARIFKILKPLLMNNSIELEAFWNLLTGIDHQTEIKGILEKESFIVYDYGKKISRNWLSKLFIEKFKGSKIIKWEYPDEKLDKRVKITKYVFQEETFDKLSVKYNFGDVEASPEVVQGGKGGELSSDVSDLADHVDHSTEKGTL